MTPVRNVTMKGVRLAKLGLGTKANVLSVRLIFPVGFPEIVNWLPAKLVGSIASVNVMMMVPFGGNPVSPASGDVELTLGGVMSISVPVEKVEVNSDSNPFSFGILIVNVVFGERNSLGVNKMYLPE
ncbi:hypothetical protein LPTSP4_19840 [Leptospira ryugenii]|uniref:Uncharacterized protein n=1 Tax=Leptospira ryugenii TaxID=1917863 RepID=A0A2P2E0R1_9LEPT|nr:hypothetical protein LPTSP4_19840 [Leptospira ryugenii]